MFTKTILTALLLAATAVPVAKASATAEDKPALAAIDGLDLSRYQGRWFEIAKYPNRFQQKCVRDTSAEYAPQPDGTVRVVNSCRLASGEMDEAVGTARRTGESNSATLVVRFAPAWLSFLPWVWGNYWVIDIDADYQLVAVSEPTRTYLWILARSPKVAPDAYAALLQRLQAKGFDLGKLERSLHQTD